MEGEAAPATRKNAVDGGDQTTMLDMDGETITVFVPFRRHRCCFGCFSLRTAARLIALAESIAMVLLFIELVHFYVQDGTLFYTTELRGTGAAVAKWGLASVAAGMLTVLAMLLSLRQHIYWMAVPHTLFQAASVCYMCYLCGHIWLRAKSDYGPQEHRIPLPTAVVLIIQIGVPAALQAWFLVVTCELVWYMRTVRRETRRRYA